MKRFLAALEMTQTDTTYTKRKFEIPPQDSRPVGSLLFLLPLYPILIINT
ncbi:MAG: hypothetical protein ACK5NK_16725 [Niabella sp.]